MRHIPPSTRSVRVSKSDKQNSDDAAKLREENSSTPLSEITGVVQELEDASTYERTPPSYSN
jgi:hypothetical protein